MKLITSRLFDVPHGFSTRDGGVSAGAFASLNAGLQTGDERAQVEENLRRLAIAASARSLATVSQVHGVEVARAGGRPTLVPPPFAEADAVWTDELGVAVGIKTADCVPVLLLDRRRRAVAAVHAGWRGTLAEIVSNTIAVLRRHGSEPGDLVAAVGPCIRRCCYEVSPELAQRFAHGFGPSVIDGSKLDLVRAIELTLQWAGVRAGQVEVVDGCTACDAARFYSHRRDRGVTGRHLSFVTCG